MADIDCSYEDTFEISQAVEHSLKRIYPNELEISLRGKCTDIGGGGTKWALARELSKRNLTHAIYLVATCSLHNVQTYLRNTVQNVLGEG